jgi:hypothetical protein
MEKAFVRVEESGSSVAEFSGTLGYWFYFGFYASPAMLAELEMRTT